MKISSLGPVSRQLLKAAVALGMILFPRQLHADPSASSDIFPKRGETLDRETTAPKLAERLSPCMTLTSNKSLPSGYGRVFVSESGEKPEIRLERSTFQDRFIDSCLIDRMKEHLAKNPGPRSWKYVHVVSECMEKKRSGFYDPSNVECKVNVVLNNFSENSELKEIVESHWKKEGLETSRTFYNAAQILKLLRIIKN